MWISRTDRDKRNYRRWGSDGAESKGPPCSHCFLGPSIFSPTPDVERGKADIVFLRPTCPGHVGLPSHSRCSSTIWEDVSGLAVAPAGGHPLRKPRLQPLTAQHHQGGGAAEKGGWRAGGLLKRRPPLRCRLLHCAPAQTRH